MDLDFDPKALAEACHEVVRANGLTSGFIRPVRSGGARSAGLHPGESPFETS